MLQPVQPNIQNIDLIPAKSELDLTQIKNLRSEIQNLKKKIQRNSIKNKKHIERQNKDLHKKEQELEDMKLKQRQMKKKHLRELQQSIERLNEIQATKPKSSNLKHRSRSQEDIYIIAASPLEIDHKQMRKNLKNGNSGILKSMSVKDLSKTLMQNKDSTITTRKRKNKDRSRSKTASMIHLQNYRIAAHDNDEENYTSSHTFVNSEIDSASGLSMTPSTQRLLDAFTRAEKAANMLARNSRKVDREIDDNFYSY